MRPIVLLILILTAFIFIWRWILRLDDKIEAKKWGMRVIWSSVFATVVVLLFFGLTTANSWRLF